MVARKQYVVDLRDGSGRSIKFDAPVNATPNQIGVLAQRALKREAPGQTFQRPRLDRAVAQQAKAFDASASATPDTLRNRTSDKARLMARGVGFSDEKANQIADRTSGAADFVPGIGDAIGADDALRAYKRGDYGEAAIGALATAAGTIPVLGDAAGVGMKAMFLGAKAKTADKAKLALAEEMQAAGAPREDILRETGWFKGGTDGKWRFETDDRQLKVSGKAVREATRDPKLAAMSAANKLAKENGYPEARYIPTGTPLREQAQDLVNNTFREVDRGQRFGAVASFPDLEAAYPDVVNDISVARVGNMQNLGSWHDDLKRLSLRPGELVPMSRSTMAHELQHMVQGQEGFPRGAHVGQAPSVHGGESYQAVMDGITKMRGMLDAPDTPEYTKRAILRALPDFEKRADEAAKYEGYRRVAGEVEARNVQTRLDMTPEERLAKPPWETQEFPDEDQFNIWGGDGAASAEDPIADPMRLYHGGKIDGPIRGPLWTAEDRGVAETYAKDRGGSVNEFDFAGTKLATADDIYDAARTVGVEVDDMTTPYEYISPNMGGWNAEVAPKVLAELQKRGFQGAKTWDFAMDDPFKEIESVAVFDPALLSRPNVAASAEDPIAAKWEDVDLDPVGSKWGLEGADSPQMISTRRPTAPNFGTYGNPDETLLIQSGDALRATPKAFDKNMGQLAEEPFMAGVTGSSDDIYREGVNRGSENLEFIVNDLMTPEQVDKTRIWYETANKLAGDAARSADYPLEAGYGVAAVTSPQKPWDINVANTTRLFDMTKQGWQSSPDEVKAGLKWVDDRIANGTPGAVAGRGPEYAARILASPMDELDDQFDRYAKVVLTDAVRNDPAVMKVLPSGEYTDEKFGNITWGSGTEIGKALRILDDPSMKTISSTMDGGGKVPSFYNNIAAPNSNALIATIDTHSAGATGLFPGGGKDPIVYRGMGLGAPKGGALAAASPDSSGAKGVYGPMVDMHALAGERLGMLPREVQSATWEGVRSLWGTTGKTPALKRQVEEIWRTSKNPQDARRKIKMLLGR